MLFYICHTYFNRKFTSDCPVQHVWNFPSHYFLHCPLFYVEQSTLLSNIHKIDSTIFNKSESVVTRILLYGNQSSKDEVNLQILNATIDFVLSTNRFLMNHFIFSEFTGVFLFIHNYMATLLQFLKFQFSCLVITFLVSLAPTIVMVPGDCCFYFYCVNVHFHRKKTYTRWKISPYY